MDHNMVGMSKGCIPKNEKKQQNALVLQLTSMSIFDAKTWKDIVSDIYLYTVAILRNNMAHNMVGMSKGWRPKIEKKQQNTLVLQLTSMSIFDAKTWKDILLDVYLYTVAILSNNMARNMVGMSKGWRPKRGEKTAKYTSTPTHLHVNIWR